jgi:iron complex outermembrane receptor protein
MISIVLSLGLLCPKDTVIKETAIDEVVVSSTLGSGKKAVSKGRVASIDEHLGKLSKVEMVRRGNYAWEPVVNNMATERVSTTIDGMKIFYACTDKMDPVTSYVESSNLQRISLNSGLDGNPQATGNIGGSIDLKLQRVGFDARQAEYNASAGFESNGHVQVYGADAAFSSHRLYSNFGVFYRHAGNYKAGGNKEVEFSQFKKTNAFANFGWQPVEDHIIEATAIYDIATDIGYPALTMDVVKAEAIITSLSYRQEHLNGLFHRWETKAYYNHITHNMDDTKRPDVVIHMDMPGKSQTAGIYSLLQGNKGAHYYQMNYDAYYNTLFADMTMYPDGGQPMYMLTWPDVSTLNMGIAATDDIVLGPHHIRLSTKLAWQNQHIGSDEGFKALNIYFPGIDKGNSRFVGRVAASYAYERNGLKLAVGTGYGMRAPTVTEGYGYFLNNTFDRYDYIGNPHLKNEKAIEVNASFAWKSQLIAVKAEANAFFFQDYIIGRPDTRLSAMTIGAAGVKIYQNLRYARIVNTMFSADIKPFSWLLWENRLSYSYGSESTHARLPLIAPLSYLGSLKFVWHNFEAEGGVHMAARNTHCGTEYGELPTAGYAVWHLNVGTRLQFRKVTANLHFGIENLFDRYYSTYSDWNHIPQKGRNIYVNTSFQL